MTRCARWMAIRGRRNSLLASSKLSSRTRRTYSGSNGMRSNPALQRQDVVLSRIERHVFQEPVAKGETITVDREHDVERAFLRMPAGKREVARALELTPEG